MPQSSSKRHVPESAPCRYIWWVSIYWTHTFFLDHMSNWLNQWIIVLLQSMGNTCSTQSYLITWVCSSWHNVLCTLRSKTRSSRTQLHNLDPPIPWCPDMQNLQTNRSQSRNPNRITSVQLWGYNILRNYIIYLILSLQWEHLQG